jgi:hypothetical protein
VILAPVRRLHPEAVAGACQSHFEKESAMSKKRTRSRWINSARAAKVYRELKNVAAVARRLGRSYDGVYRNLARNGVI